MMVWCATSGGTLVPCMMETDSTDPSYQPLPDILLQLQGTIEEMRSKIIENFTNIERKKAQEEKIKRMDDARKGRVKDTVEKILSRNIKRVYFEKINTWLRIRRSARRRKDLARGLLASTEKGLLGIYYIKWTGFTKANKRQAQRNALAGALLRTTNQGLQSLYVRNLLEYVRRNEKAAKRTEIAEVMLKTTRKGLMLLSFAKWKRWQERVHQKAKRDAIAKSLFGTTEKGMMVVYYQKVLDFYAKMKQFRKRELIADTILCTTERGRARHAFLQFLKFRKAKKEQAQKRQVSGALERVTERGMRSVYYNKWFGWLRLKAQLSLDAKNTALLEKIRSMRKLVDECSVMTDEQIAEAIHQVNSDIREIQKEIAEIEAIIAERENKHRELARELIQNVRIDPTLPVAQQVDQIMRIIKAKGVLCGAHIKTIQEVRERETKLKKKPAVTYNAALGDLRRIISEMAGTKQEPGSTWMLPENAVKNMADRQHKAAMHAIREMVISWDCLMNRNQNRDEVLNMIEVVFNSGYIMEIIMREWQRTHPVPDTKPVAKLQLQVPPVVYSNEVTQIGISTLDAKGDRVLAAGTVTLTCPQLSSVPVEIPFTNGSTRFPLTLPNAGSYTLDFAFEHAKETALIAAQKSEPHAIQVVGPRDGFRNESIELTVKLVDQTGRVIMRDGALEVSSTVGPLLSHPRLDHGEGKIKVQLGATAERGTITILDPATKINTVHDVDVKKPLPPSNIVVTAPSKIKVGDPFTVEFKVVNEKGAPVKVNGAARLESTADIKSEPVEIHGSSGTLTGVVTSAAHGATVSVVVADCPARGSFTIDAFAPAAPAPKPAKAPAKAAPKAAPAKAPPAPKPWIGFEIADQEGADALSVKSVIPGGPAERAGVLAGDRVASVGGRVVKDLAGFRLAMRDYLAVGKIAALSFTRGAEKVDVSISVGNLADKPATANN